MQYPLPYVETNLVQNTPEARTALDLFKRSFYHNNLAQKHGVNIRFTDMAPVMYLDFKPGEDFCGQKIGLVHHMYGDRDDLYQQQPYKIKRTSVTAIPNAVVIKPGQYQNHEAENELTKIKPDKASNLSKEAALATVQKIAGSSFLNKPYFHIFVQPKLITNLMTGWQQNEETALENFNQKLTRPLMIFYNNQWADHADSMNGDKSRRNNKRRYT